MNVRTRRDEACQGRGASGTGPDRFDEHQSSGTASATRRFTRNQAATMGRALSRPARWPQGLLQPGPQQFRRDGVRQEELASWISRGLSGQRRPKPPCPHRNDSRPERATSWFPRLPIACSWHETELFKVVELAAALVLLAYLWTVAHPG